MALRIGDTAPDFKAQTSEGPISFHEFLGNGWGVLFSHPADFTPVCTTELGKLALLKDEFTRRNVKVIAISVDSLDRHRGWINDINETQSCTVNYPIIADEDRKISQLYGMLDQTNADSAGMPLTVRSVFIIGNDKKIKLIMTYPASTGRNFHEILRCIDSLQLTANYKTATPADWTPGKEVVILPSIPNEQADQLFPKGYNAIRPWLRLTPDPTA